MSSVRKSNIRDTSKDLQRVGILFRRVSEITLKTVISAAFKDCRRMGPNCITDDRAAIKKKKKWLHSAYVNIRHDPENTLWNIFQNEIEVIKICCPLACVIFMFCHRHDRICSCPMSLACSYWWLRWKYIYIYVLKTHKICFTKTCFYFLYISIGKSCLCLGVCKDGCELKSVVLECIMWLLHWPNMGPNLHHSASTLDASVPDSC